jgi:hypothetical protein
MKRNIFLTEGSLFSHCRIWGHNKYRSSRPILIGSCGVDHQALRVARAARVERLHRRIYAACLERMRQNRAKGNRS